MRRKRVVVVLPNTAYGRHVMQGIVKFAAQCGGWDFLYKGNAADPMVLYKAAAAAEWWADGLIGHFIDAAFLSRIQNLPIPSVNVSSWFQTDKPVRVHTDEYLVGKAAAEYFIASGIKHFAYWGYTFGDYSAQRRDGFKQTLEAKGYGCDVIDSTITTGMRPAAWVDREEQLGRRLLRMPKPVGLLCVNDMVAREVLWVIERLNMRCPDDLAVLGVENDELACLVCMPPLSSIELAATRIGHEAAAMLDRMMRGNVSPSQPQLVAPIGVVSRQSTDIVAIDNDLVRDAIRYVRAHAQEPIDVGDILKAVPISRRALELHFKRLLRRTPRQQIQYERVQLVKKLLLETDLSVAQIAEQSGFPNPTLFWSVFRRYTGRAPTAYRRHFH